MNKLLFLLAFVLLASCGGESIDSDLKAQISAMEDSITKISKNLAYGEQIDPSLDNELLELLKDYYAKYPDTDYAAECLDKIHMKYAGMGNYEMSANYADTLIDNYPDYVNRALLLESQANNFDFYIKPRDTAKVRFYYELLLKEFPDLPGDKKKGIQDRLDHIDLTIEEMIIKNN